MAKLTHAQAVARAKKAARTRKRNAGKTSTRRSPAKKATRRRARRSTMSQFMTPAATRGAVKSGGNGLAGGALAAFLDRMLLPKMNPIAKMVTTAAVGFGMAAVAKRPNIGAGMIGYAGGKLADMFMDGAGMSEGPGYLEQNNEFAMDIAGMPSVLDTSGQPMEENDYLSDGDMYLDENGDWYQVDRDIAPDFSNPFGN